MLTEKEKRELKNFCDRIKGKADRLESELKRLLDTVEEIAAFVYTRRALEIIIIDICENELKRPRGTEPLQGILSKIRKERCIPENVIFSMEHLNKLGNLGAHPLDYYPSQLKEAFLSLATVVEWYVADYKSLQAVKDIADKKCTSDSVLKPNPYMGLDTFQEEDADWFFGREKIIDILWNKFKVINEKQSLAFLPVLGPSGSGKSSVVRAGLIPKLKKELKTFNILTIKPTGHPISFLYSELIRFISMEDKLRKDFHAPEFDMEKEPFQGLHNIISSITDNGSGSFVLVIDQFEELYTLCKEEKERTAFIKNLINAAYPNGHLIIIIVFRIDYLGETRNHLELNKIISDKHVIIPMMGEEELHRSIAKPAEAAGNPFDEYFIEQLIKQTQEREGTLPLLQLALYEIWEGRINGVAPEKTLKKMGGVGGALSQKAQETYDALSKEQKAVAKSVFLKLVKFGEGFRYNCRRVRITELIPFSKGENNTLEILARFSSRDVRLITLSYNLEYETLEEGYETAEITHEALLNNWAPLKKWIEVNKEHICFDQRLMDAVNHWDSYGRPNGLLWREPDLSLLSEYHSSFLNDMNELQLRFFNASHYRHQQSKWIKSLIFAALSILVIALGFLTYHLSETKKEIQSRLALSYWQNSHQYSRQNQGLKSLHLSAAALRLNPNKFLDKNLWINLQSFWPHYQLDAILTHDGPVTGVRLTFDNKQMLTWGDDGAVKLWVCKTRKRAIKPMMHQGPVSGALFSKNEDRILTWGKDGTARIWNRHNGEQIGLAMHHQREVYGAMFSKGENRVLTWCYDDTASLWDAESGERVSPPFKHKRLSGAVFTDDDKTIVTWGYDNSVRFWDADSGILKGNPIILDGWVNGLKFNKEQTAFLTWSQSGLMTIWDAETGNRIVGDMKHDGPVLEADFNRSESRILSWSEDGSIRLWELSTGMVLHIMQHACRVDGAVFNADESRILSWAENGAVCIWDAETGQRIGKEIATHGAVYGAKFYNGETQVLVWGKTGVAQIWDLNTRKTIGTEMLHDGPIYGALLDGASSIITYGKDGAVRIWTKDGSGKPDIMLSHKGSIEKCLFDSGNRRLIAWGREAGMQIRDTEMGNRLCQTTEEIKGIKGIALYNGGKTCLAWYRDGGIRIWDIENCKTVGAEMIHKKIIRAQLIQNHKRILSWGEDGAARIWDAATGRQIGLTMMHSDTVNGAIFNTAKNTILTYSMDGTARQWNADTCEPTGIVLKHENVISGAVCYDNGKRILTWSIDGTAVSWDGETGLQIGSKMHHEDWVAGAMINRDNSRIITWGKDHALKVWEAMSGKQIGSTLFHKNTILGAIFNTDQTRVISWSKDGTVRIVNTNNGKDTGITLSHQGAISGVSLNQDRKQLLTWSADGSIRIWDLNNGYQKIASILHESPINGATYNRDQSQILAWDQSGKVCLWDAYTGEQIGLSLYHKNSILGAFFSADERQVLSWDNETMIIRQIQSDMKLTKDAVERQVSFMTGTEFDPRTQMIKVLEPIHWRELKRSIDNNINP